MTVNSDSHELLPLSTTWSSSSSEPDGHMGILQRQQQQNEDRTPLLRDHQQLSDRQEPEPSSSGFISNQDEKDDIIYGSPFRFWAVILSYVCILFLFACNGTVITTTYGSIAEDLHAYATAATWLNASYMVCHPFSFTLLSMKCLLKR